MAKKLLVLNGGRLFNSDINKSIEKFAEVTGYAESFIKSVLSFDEALRFIGYSIINDYKLGRTDTNTFLVLLSHRLWLSNEFDSELLSDAWNAMCKFDKVAKENCTALLENLSADPEMECMVITNTNELHFKYNEMQLREILGDKISRVKFQSSYEHNTFSYQQLFEAANIGNDREIISLVYGVDFKANVTDMLDKDVPYCDLLKQVPTSRVSTPTYNPNTVVYDVGC